MPNDIADRLAIRDIVENWVLWRDARQWDRFRTLWHAEGRMWATWFQGTFEEFIAVSQQGYERGARIHHMLGGLRHFIWDTGHGMGAPARDNLAIGNLVASVILTIIVVVIGFMVA